MRHFILVLFSLVALSPLFAQSQTQSAPQEVVVRVKTEASPQAERPTVEKAHEWVQFGQHVGSAMREGLSALTDEANKFAGTPAGHFTMAVIAWKVAGDDAMQLLDRITGAVFGIPTLIAWNILAIWFYRRMFLPRRVVIESSGTFWTRSKKWQVVNEDDNWGDGKVGAAFVTCAVWVIVSLVILFQVILGMGI